MRRVKSPFGGFGRPVSSTFFLRCSFENQFKDTSGVDPVAGTVSFSVLSFAFGSHFKLSLPGRSWRASELRLKSFEDLHKLWFVLAKERNILLAERAASRTTKEAVKNPSRYRKVFLSVSTIHKFSNNITLNDQVRKAMARIKHVLGERQRIYKEFKQQQILALENHRLEEEKEIQRRLMQKQKDVVLGHPHVVLAEFLKKKEPPVLK